MKVCHSCDNPPCYEIEHLFLGTTKKNAEDMVAKDRQARGTRAASAKLTDAQVLAIRADPRSHRVLGNQYGVHPSMISYIKSRRYWKHL